MKDRINHRFSEQLIFYTAIFSIASFVILGCFFVHGLSLIGECDPLDISWPEYTYYFRWYKDILTGKGIRWYDLSIGLGNNVLDTLNFNGLFDPFSLLLLLCWNNAKYVPFVTSIVTVVKIYVAGVTMLIAVNEYVKDKHLSAAIAVAYAYSIYGIRAGLHFSFFTSGMISLPLIISGIDLSISERKIKKRLVIGVAYQAICGFYLLFTELVFAALYGLISLIMNLVRNKKISAEVANLAKLFAQVFMGLGIGAFVFVPSVLGFLSSSRAGQDLSFATGIRTYGGNYYKALLQGILGVLVPNTTMSRMDLLIVCILFLFLISALLSSKVKIQNKIIFVISFLALYSETVGLFFNGLSYSQNERWTFVTIFFAYYLIADRLGKEEIIQRFPVVLLVALLVFKCILDYEKVMLAFVIIAIASIVVYFKFNRPLLILIITIINVCISDLMIFGPLEDVPVSSNYLDYYSLDDYYNGNVIYDYIDVSMSNPWRIDIGRMGRGNVNGAMFYRQFGTSSYFSMTNSNVQRFAKAYGIAEVDPLHVYGFDQRELLEDIFAVKYIYNPVLQTEKPSLIENVDYINWFLVYDKISYSSQFDNLDMLQRYDLLTQAVIVSDADNIPINDVYEEKTRKYRELEFTIDDEEMNSVNTYTIASPDLRINILGEYDLNDELFIYVKNIYSENELGNISVSNKKIGLSCKDVAQQDKSLFARVYPDENGTFMLGFDDVTTMEDVRIFAYDTIGGTLSLQELNTAENVYVDNDYISGTVYGPNRIVCIPVFFDKYWSATINGEVVKTYDVNNGLTGIITTSEVNNIELSYKYGKTIFCPFLIISVLSTVIFVLIIMKDTIGDIYARISKEKHDKNEKY